MSDPFSNTATRLRALDRAGSQVCFRLYSTLMQIAEVDNQEVRVVEGTYDNPTFPSPEWTSQDEAHHNGMIDLAMIAYEVGRKAQSEGR